MDRISKLDIDFNQLSNQLADLSKKFEEKFGALLQDEGFWASVKNFFVKFIFFLPFFVLSLLFSIIHDF